jgi:hypothetical protein
MERLRVLLHILELEHYQFDLIASDQEKRDKHYSDVAWQIRLDLDRLLREWGPETSRDIWDLVVIHNDLKPNERQQHVVEPRLGPRTMPIGVLNKMLGDVSRLSQ